MRAHSAGLGAAVAVVLATLAVTAPVAAALPPCSGAQCHSSGMWFWNKAAARYQLFIDGLDAGGSHYTVTTAVCYGIGRETWGSKGPQFQRFHCAVRLTDEGGTTYQPYGITFYVRGHYAWTWSHP